MTHTKVLGHKLWIASLILLLLLLAGCGRKPVGLLPPDDAMADAYPQVYPKPQPGEHSQTYSNLDLETKYKARPEPSLQ